MAMIATQDIALKNFFRKKIVLNDHNLPSKGPFILAPTHRSRWDGLMITMAAGRRITKKDCRFMVTHSEMNGIQGWFLNRLGCFPIHQGYPTLLSMRYALDLILANEQLVVFPEGKINRTGKEIPLKQGLIRLAQLSLRQGAKVHVIPVGVGYSEMIPNLLGKAALCFGKPLIVDKLGKAAALEFNLELRKRMHAAEKIALKNVGRVVS
tara:strand:- start:653 stop:1279 length:627 start_codon:yes stop_codon:yes gene_type:complete